MKNNVSKEDQYALISFFAKELGHSQSFGKKALQKVVHLLQELTKIDTGYQFSFYTYGPYSSELSNDLDVAAQRGGVKILYNPEDQYYLIQSGDNTPHAIESGKRFLENNRNEIDKVTKLSRGKTAKDLELISTIVFLQTRDKSSDFSSQEAMVARVQSLKPKYRPYEIEKAIEKVKSF